jgi:microcin C transport system substrate-binding protein
LKLLYKAGCTVDTEGVLRLPSGQPFRFEILLDSASGMVWERVVLPFKDRLKKLGIDLVVRTVDSIQYKNRLDNYDFDMVVMVWGQSFAPGNEQRYFWGSQSADTIGSWNYAGIKNPAVDALIEKIVMADTQEEHRVAVKALDRVLLHLCFVIPNWYTPEHRYLFWDKFGMPDVVPIKGMNILNWWYQEKNKING